MIIGPWFSFFAGVVVGAMLMLSALLMLVVVVSMVTYRRARRARFRQGVDQSMRAAAERATNDVAAATSTRR